MNRQIKQISLLVGVLFMVLLLNLTNMQVVKAPALNADSRNARMVYAAYGRDRGPVVVGGKPIAKSEPIDDAFKYLRVYDQGVLYAHITGYFSTAFTSMTGLERAADDVLSGNSSSMFMQRVQDLITGAQPQGGGVELTIDPVAQQAAWDALGGRRGAAVALDPKTGAVLAQVSSPSFDPNTLASHDNATALASLQALEKDPNKPLYDRALAGDLYPPGSVFKIITASAMLRSGKYTPDTELDAPVTLTLPNTTSTLSNYGGQSCNGGRATLAKAFDLSCNTPFAKAAMDLGSKALEDEAAAYGFGTSINTPLPVTASVFGKDLDMPALAHSSIGQRDVRVTPMQMALVAATVANDGKQMKPYLVAREMNADLETLATTAPQLGLTPIDSSVAAQLKQMMVSEVSAGTGYQAAIPGISVAGKTGTAETGQAGAPHTWFVGFAPADNPKVAVAVVVEGGDQGTSANTGGTVAAPIAKRIMQAVLR